MIDSIKLFFYSVRLHILVSLEYASYMFCWLLMIPIEGFSGILLLKLITQRISEINGWDFGHLAFIYGLSIVSHGVQDLLYIQTRFLDRLILKGELDRFLLRPRSPFFQFSMVTFNIVGLFSWIPAFIVFYIGCKTINFPWTFINIIYVLLIIIGGSLIRCALHITTSSFAFWTAKSGFFLELNLAMEDKFVSYPLSIYPSWIQGIFTFILPLGFVSFYPISGLLGMDAGQFPLPLDIVYLSPVVGIICFMLAKGVFNYGLKYKYESVGS